MPFCERFHQLESVLDDNDVLTMKTGMLYDGATIRMIASALWYVEKPLRFVCSPVWVSASGHDLLADKAVEALIDEIPSLALITPKRSEAELALSHKRRNVSISSLADFVSGIKGTLHDPRFRSGGVRSITPITKAILEWIEMPKKCVMLEKDFGIWRSRCPRASR